MRLSYILLMICFLMVLLPPVSAGVAQLSWTKTIGYCVTAIDTNPTGTLILVGLGNGSIFAYDNTGNITWSNSTNTTATSRAIKKIVADSSGNIAWISTANETGYIAYSGAVAGIVSGTGRNMTDVAITGDGGRYITTELSPPRIIVRYPNGSSEVQNTTYGASTYWTKVGYDPFGTWVVTANQSDNTLYFWNFSAWTGWEQFNPNRVVTKNASQIHLDSFPYRQNISVNESGSIGLTFRNNTTNITYIQKLNNSYYEYNSLNTGPYFYWTVPGNISDNQTGLLNLSWINTSSSQYNIVLRSNRTNYTIYYGNTSYNNSIINNSWRSNGTKLTMTYFINTTWVVPARVVNGSIFLVGGGGSGHYGYDGDYYGGYHYWGDGGEGGFAGNQTSNSSVNVTPGNSYPIVIGSGGIGNGTAGTASSAFGYSATGGDHGASGTGSTTPDPGQSGFDGNISAGCGTGNENSGFSVCGGGAGGSGYGAGGGGGYGGYDHTPYGGGYGGTGSSGYVNFSFITYDVPIYYYGITPTSSTLFVQQSRQTGVAMNRSASKVYVGTILGISVPSTGQLASIITDTIFYQQYVSSGGFGVTYCATLSSGAPALFAGVPYAYSTSNSGTASMEGRGAYGNIYDASGVAKASSLTGGTVRAVDVAMSSGLFGVFGGDEGKVYMLSREGSTSWYSYYTGTADTPISAVSVLWDGSGVIVGRFGGTLEYYITNVTIPVTPTPVPNVDTTIYAFKDSAVYANQPITIYTSPTEPSSWTPVTTLYTDSMGKIAYSAMTGAYYKFVVNNVVGTTSGEGETIWQANAATPTVYIYVVSPSTPYEWNAYYAATTHNVTVVYSDSITPTSITVSIKDLKTNLVVMTRVYLAQPSFTLEYNDVLGNGSYQVNIIINRLGMTVRDQRIVTSPDVYGISIPVDKYILWAISTIALMVMAGMFSYSHSKRGALLVVGVAVGFMWFGMLPWSMITVAMLAAMLAVMSLFGSRVQ
jgi:hypothetical protein